MLIREGDAIAIRYDDTDIDGLKQIRSWSRK